MTSGTPVTLNIESAFGWTDRSSSTSLGLQDIVRELQGLQIQRVTGGNQSTAISLKSAGGSTGNSAKITTSDPILGAFMFEYVAASGLVGITFRSDVRCASTGNVQFSGGATTADQGLVFWLDKTGYIAR
jgi:hypothetical protein